MYCKVTHPILSYAAVQQQQRQLNQFILNLQTPSSATSASPSATNPSATPGAPDAQLPGQSQPAQPSQLNQPQPSQLNQAQAAQPQPQLIPLATVLDSAQGDAIWFASPRNAQLLLESAQLPRRELELSEAGSPLLYRAVGCNRARRCCCTCTKLCDHRCLHDCFVRLWLWKRELDSLGVATSPAQFNHPAHQCKLLNLARVRKTGALGWCRQQARTSQPNARC